MKEPGCTEEIANILQEAPAARKALLDNYNNLRNVAEYCESSYLQVSNFHIIRLKEDVSARAQVYAHLSDVQLLHSYTSK